MALNPTGGNSYAWNYHKPTEPGYSTELVGTVVALQEVQAMNFGAGGKPTTPKFWDNGGPVWNIRILFTGPSGGFRSWTFQPASKAARNGEKKSVHLDLFALTGNTDMKNLIGKTLRVATVPGNYGLGAPRPWTVEEVPGVGPYVPNQEIPAEFLVDQLLANAAATGGQMVQPVPMPQSAPVAPVQPLESQMNPGVGVPTLAQQQAPQPQTMMTAQAAPVATPAPQAMPDAYDADIPF